ncbi:hydantoinase B/oxoprolinase family protein [Caballeronia novacaledonica]|uniref:hydantoinase B/oxoprolinase family protein n=1 Tax=Caballeronia novacaledonica TaxID=1544861 RepID=UPI001EE2E2B9|nr:hydantoinase B/oxoprolinase family protein [Caballeronia novacaledonica]GJH09980.1 hydantoinase B/oxoprolinase family protein [Caballeronia novacaledonica]
MVDRITAEIVRQYLETVSEEISKTMENTSVSPAFSEAHDYSTGIFYARGTQVDLLARANSQPVHIYASLTSVEAMLREFKYNLNEGDMIIATDPYFGGSHLPDWTVMKPIFYNNKPVFFPAVRAHFMEIGGPVPGGYNSKASEIWQEGFRLAPMKICEKGEMRRDVVDLLRANNRLPDAMMGDLNAMIGSCKVGEDRILRLIEKYGLETIIDTIGYLLDYSEKQVRSVIAAWPDGVYRGQSILDHDFGGGEDINVDVAITVEGDTCSVDLTGTHEQTQGFINSAPGNSLSWVYTEFSVAMAGIPVNSGFFRPIKVHLPKGTVVNPYSPAPVGNSTLCIGNDIGQATMKALEKVVPERTGSAFIDLTIDVIFGLNKRYDSELYISFDYSAAPVSSGGAYGADGWGGYAAPHGSLRIPSFELMEVLFPFLYLQNEYGIDTAAPGRWRGSPAHLMQRRATTDAVGNHFQVQHSRYPLKGFAGGGDSVGNLVVLDYTGPNEEPVYIARESYFQQPGEIVFARKQGGGGWGDPLERDPELVLRDVLDEYISPNSAFEDYGVVIVEMDAPRVDLAETQALRARLRAAVPAAG